MGNASSMLTQYDIEEVQDHFSQQEIVSLYQRFCQLDRNAKGFISADEFLSVPEFAMNPLSQRLLKMVDGLNFKDFVAFLSAFSAKASLQQKIELIFKVYDSDGNGKVSFNDILEVLHDLSGSFISDDQREQVLSQLLIEAGYSKGSFLMLSDFFKPTATLLAALANSLRRQAKGNILLKMFSMSMAISFSGLMNSMLAYFAESVTSVIIELIEQDRFSNFFETQNLSFMKFLPEVLLRKKMEPASSGVALDSSRKKLSGMKNFKAANSGKLSTTRSNQSGTDISADSVMKQENLVFKLSNEGASSSNEIVISNPTSEASRSFCEGKMVLHAEEAGRLSMRLRILEEENEIMKQAFSDTMVERKKLIDETFRLFQTLRSSLQEAEHEYNHASLIIEPSKGGGSALSSRSQVLVENLGLGDSKADILAITNPFRCCVHQFTYQ